MNLKYLQNLKVIKRFKDGHKSAGAYLLENNIVKKIYDINNPSHKRRFKIEIKNLKHLKSCPFVPNILAIDKKNATFYMNYCGTKPENTKENINKNHILIKSLYHDWGMARKSINSPKLKTSLQNTAIDGDKMFIIDFGSSNWIKF